MKVLLVDDEEIALEVLERMLCQIDNVEILGKYTDPEKALVRLKTEGADAVFLDFEMGGRHGLQFAQELLNMDSSPEVIFVTAYSQYAVDAFEVDALDYLVKPVTLTRLMKAVQKIEERQSLKQIQKVRSNSNKTNIYIRSLGSFQMFSGEEAAIPVRWRTKKVKEMFCYLWLNKKNPVNKYRLLEDLWPEVTLDKGTALLHTTIYQSRKALKELGFEEGIDYINDNYILTLPLKSDLEELRGILKESRPTEEQIRRLILLYQGDLLEHEEYSWCIYEQQNLRKLYLDCLQRYIDQNTGRAWNNIMESCLLKLVQMDSYNEQFVLLLLSYYGDMDNISGLIETYEHYSKVLKEELGIMPSRKVIGTYRKYIKTL